MSSDAEDEVVEAASAASASGSASPDEGVSEPEEADVSTEPLAEDWSTDADATAIEHSFEQVLAEREEYLEALRRLQAEFENYRKRTIRQQTELLERAAQSLIDRLLPVLDALDLAVAHAGESSEPNGDAAALAQIASLLRTTLEKEGLERIDESGVPFDPTRHDAVAHVERDPDEEAVPGGIVDEVLRSGYVLKGRVLRPAMVKVRG